MRPTRRRYTVHSRGWRGWVGKGHITASRTSARDQRVQVLNESKSRTQLPHAPVQLLFATQQQISPARPAPFPKACTAPRPCTAAHVCCCDDHTRTDQGGAAHEVGAIAAHPPPAMQRWQASIRAVCRPGRYALRSRVARDGGLGTTTTTRSAAGCIGLPRELAAGMGQQPLRQVCCGQFGGRRRPAPASTHGMVAYGCLLRLVTVVP